MHIAPSLAFALVLLPTTGPAQTVERSVRFVYELANTGKNDLTDVELRLVLPPSLERQKILLLKVGSGAKTKHDAYGNKVAIFKKVRLAPGAKFAAQWFATVALRDMDRLKPRRVEPLGKEDRARYLADRKVYDITNPRVVEIADGARAIKDAVQRVGFIHDSVCDLMRYVRDGRWDPAPVCLERGTGSCSEYTYSFIAVCRAAGLPARWVGGTALRDAKADSYEDGVFHRWAQVWLDDRGWFPVDCSRDDGEDQSDAGRRRFFGRTAWPLLVLARGDGGTHSLTDWSYHAKGVWKGRGGRSRRRGYWTGPVSQKRFALLARRTERAEPKSGGERQVLLFLSGCGDE